jgi:hypothetical protein
VGIVVVFAIALVLAFSFGILVGYVSAQAHAVMRALGETALRRETTARPARRCHLRVVRGGMA